MPICILCERELEIIPDRGWYLHPEADDCEVKYTDGYGIAIDETVDEEPAPERNLERTQSPFFEGIDVQIYPSVDVVLAELFDSVQLTRLGGASTGSGWSNFQLFQRCPHAWWKRYIEQARPLIAVESPAIAIGSLIHTYLALHYLLMIEPDYGLTPEAVYDFALRRANPQFVGEAWRVFMAYTRHYALEEIQPLAIEYNLVDPRTRESCRYDLIAYFPNEAPGRPEGTYIVEHKSTQRFDRQSLEGWANDGEILGQVMLWERLGLKHRFGPLRGVLVNILGKQKVPEFHRTYVAPSTWQIDQHKSDLSHWSALIGLAKATDSFPRARSGCINRFGMCEWWELCAGGEA